LRAAALAAVILAACPAVRSPEERARAALARTEVQGFSAVLAPWGELRVEPGAARWTAVTVGDGDAVFAHLSAQGRAGAIPFSYIGTERPSLRCEGDDCLVPDPAPRLRGVLTALHARRAALAAGGTGLEALAAGPYEVSEVAASAARPCAAWFIRVDREEAVVGEADDAGRQRRLVLAQRGDRWAFTSGLP
jgi:hypothetical protein